jgi:hypothetical protein
MDELAVMDAPVPADAGGAPAPTLADLAERPEQPPRHDIILQTRSAIWPGRRPLFRS